MLKQILNLEGAQELGKKEQKSVNGGKMACRIKPCPPGWFCINETYCERAILDPYLP